jgi:hypothetical protein
MIVTPFLLLRGRNKVSKPDQFRYIVELLSNTIVHVGHPVEDI